MDKKALYWKKERYLYDVMLIVFSGFIFINNLKGLKLETGPEYLFRIFLAMLLAVSFLKSIYELIYKIVVPELEFFDLSLRFSDLSKNIKKRISLSIYDIKFITEIQKKDPKQWFSEVSTFFVINTKNGEKYEYTPKTRSQTRVDEVRRFLSYFPWIPAVIVSYEDNTDESVLKPVSKGLIYKHK